MHGDRARRLKGWSGGCLNWWKGVMLDFLEGQTLRRWRERGEAEVSLGASFVCFIDERAPAGARTWEDQIRQRMLNMVYSE